VAGKVVQVAKQIDDGGLATRGACYALIRSTLVIDTDKGYLQRPSLMKELKMTILFGD
jgi:hypothetical protein